MAGGLRLLPDSVSADVEGENDGRNRPAEARWRRRHDQMLGSLTEAKCDSAQGNDTLRDALPPIPTLITAKTF